MTNAPKNKRLNDRERAALSRFALRQIEATQDRAELNTAYEGAASAVHAEVVKRWPQKDMRVLAKYDAANADPCVYVAGGAGYDYDQFCFREDDRRIALRPMRGCRNQPIRLEGPAEAAYDKFVTARKADEKQTKARLGDFKALIYNTPSFNALAEVWPAVEAMRGEIVGSGAALSVLSNEVVDRLKADPAMELANA